MDSGFSSSNSHPTSDQDFEFAFNSSNFSDRVLRIEIVADPPEARWSADARADGVVEWRDSKRKKEEFEKGEAAEIAVCDVDSNHPDFDYHMLYKNHDDEAVAMVEESPSGSDTGRTNDFYGNMDHSPVLRVKSIYISSAILAAKSPFFYKLFSNGMRESDQRHATLRINESEEEAFVDLVSYMYSKKLSSNTAPALLDVLMAADKFEVASCMSHCNEILCNLPMTPESALVYLDLPCSVSMASAVQPLKNAAKNYLATRYKDITKLQDEIMHIPEAGIEAILSDDELQVPSEDSVYDFMLKWARFQCPKLEDRREVLGSLLSRVIRFPFLTCRKLKKILTSSDVDHDLASKLVLEALFFKAEAAHRQRAIASEESAGRRFVERSYKYRPVKVVEFELPYQQCIVFLDLKREECANLFPAGRIYSQAFHLGGQGFFLSAHCNMEQQSSSHCFGLFLGMQEKGVVSLTVDYEFATRTRPNGEFASKYKGYYTFAGGKAVGYRNLFGISWASFMADDSPYFINGTLHLRAELTIKQDLAASSKLVS